MKILMIAPYVTTNSRPEFCRNKTGFGYMVYDIAKAVAKTEQVDVICTDSRGDSFEQDGIHFLQRHLLDLLPNFTTIRTFKTFRTLICQYNFSKEATIRLIYYWMLTSYIEKIVRKGHYDVIHIHGCGYSGTLWGEIANRCNVKIVYTLHGLNSFSDTIQLESEGKRYERDFLKEVIEGKKSISVISTGIKKTIMNCYGVDKCDNIHVVCNSFTFSNTINNEYIDIREKYSIPVSAKILLYVGNISENKNQIQLVRAFNLLSKKEQDNTYVLFLGRYSDDDKIVAEIEKSNKKNHLILCGAIDKKNVPIYYQQGNAVVMLSIREGFGLSLVEGMHFGIPCAMFTDMDAFEDIYSPEAVVPIKERSDADTARAVIKLLSSNWNKDTIKSYSKKFESETMAKKYIEFYRNCI